ncbi:hypothetical protein [Roseateles sp. BYS87W]|uniref:Uncharacterized protein n=1 Tax=Pelomonas baiyunensis TaxID=3299026 RepID=A0ABW7H1Q8_9BURK
MTKPLLALRRAGLALMAAGLSRAAVAAPITEAPTRLLVTGLSLPDRMATTYGWLDAHHLAVTTPPPGDDDAYSGLRRLVAVDARTGAQTVLLERGFLSCANPHTGVVAAYVGDLRKLLRGGPAAAPVLTWFRWDAQQTRLVPQPPPPGPPMHPQQCRPFDPEDDRNGQVMTGAAPVRTLEPGHGQIRWTWDPATGQRGAVQWMRGAERRTLDVPAERIQALVDWLPYRSAYLLTPGLYRVEQGQMTELLPLTTMDQQGRTAQVPTPAALAPGLSRDWTHQVFSVPMRGGQLLAVPGRSHDGAGLYRHTAQGLQRVFCGPKPGGATDDALRDHTRCFEDEPIRVSPDGCQAAFATRYDADGRLRTTGLQGQVHMLDLCGRAVR